MCQGNTGGAQRWRESSDAGSVTVELALGIVGLMLVVSLLFVGICAAGAQLGCCGDARDAARLLARGAVLPVFSSEISVQSEGEWVTVSAQRQIPQGYLVGAPMVSCTVSTVVEGGLR